MSNHHPPTKVQLCPVEWMKRYSLKSFLGLLELSSVQDPTLPKTVHLTAVPGKIPRFISTNHRETHQNLLLKDILNFIQSEFSKYIVNKKIMI